MKNDASEWLVQERSINGVGIDTISLDSGDTGKTSSQPTHRTLLGNGIWIIENVNEKLKDLPVRGFSVAALPYKIGGGSGAPIRLVAYTGNWMSSGCQGLRVNTTTSVLVVIVTFFINSIYFN